MAIGITIHGFINETQENLFRDFLDRSEAPGTRLDFDSECIELFEAAQVAFDQDETLVVYIIPAHKNAFEKPIAYTVKLAQFDYTEFEY